MKVCIDGRPMTDHFPGIGRYVHRLIDAMATMSPDDRFEVLVQPGQRLGRFSLAALAAHPNVFLRPLAAGIFSPLSQVRGPSAIVASGADVFHATYWLGPWFTGRPTVQTCYDLVGRREPGSLPGFRRQVLEAAVWLSLRRAQRVLAISETVAGELRASRLCPPERVRVSPLAVDEGFVRPAPASIAELRGRLDLGRPYVLYLGIDKPHKNLVTLLRAWGRLAGSRPDAAAETMLLLAGPQDPRYHPAIEASIAAFCPQASVRCLGPVAEQDLPALYAGARAFAFPSLHEGFGLPLLEAMACGCPVLAADATALPEVAGDAALLLPALDVAAWTAGLATVLTDQGEAERLRGAGLRRAARFTWQRTAEATLAAYREAAGS